MFSREFAFCLFTNLYPDMQVHLDAGTFLYIRQHFKETVPWVKIMWSEMG